MLKTLHFYDKKIDIYDSLKDNMVNLLENGMVKSIDNLKKLI